VADGAHSPCETMARDAAAQADAKRERTILVPSPYAEFREKLDAVLRQRDAAALRAFLITEGQWDADTTTDAGRALWLMIATSPALGDLHAAAFEWLTVHGYSAEVHALQGRSKPVSGPVNGKRYPARKGKTRPEHPHGGAPNRRD
jgi:hypothetical protein